MVRKLSGFVLALLRALHVDFARGVRIVRRRTGLPKQGEQCGGIRWQGATECESPLICQKFSDNYSECFPPPDLLLVVGAQGDAHCPESAEILRKGQCKQAAAQFGYEFRGFKGDDNFPSGCYLDVDENSKTGLYFNNWIFGRGRATSSPVCTQAPETPQPDIGLPAGEFERLMANLQNSDVSQGGYACGYADGWCGCSCGHNLGSNIPCYLPPMRPGTEGGHTCGHYGNLYGCAEAHNTLEGCPRTSGSYHGGTPTPGGKPKPAPVYPAPQPKPKPAPAYPAPQPKPKPAPAYPAPMPPYGKPPPKGKPGL